MLNDSRATSTSTSFAVDLWVWKLLDESICESFKDNAGRFDSNAQSISTAIPRSIGDENVESELPKEGMPCSREFEPR